MPKKLTPLYFIDEKVSERVAQLYEKILKNQGEVILTFRRIYLGTEPSSGDFIPPPNCLGDIFETGVIGGELKRKSEDVVISFWAHGFNHPVSYYFSSDLAVPVRSKLYWQNSKRDISKDDIDFIPRDLTEAKEGGIKLSSWEFLERNSHFGFERHSPYLERLEILIGDNEIMNFAKPIIASGFYKQEYVEDFLYLMKTPGEIERKREAGYSKEREELAEELVKNVTHLNGLYRQVSEMEERVLRLHLKRFHEGMEDMHSYIVWSDDSTFKLYTELRSKVNSNVKNINRLLKKGKGIDFVKHPAIRGKGIGFPSEIKTQDYLDYVNKNLMPSIQSTLEKLDGYLEEAQKVEV